MFSTLKTAISLQMAALYIQLTLQCNTAPEMAVIKGEVPKATTMHHDIINLQAEGGGGGTPS